MIAILESRFRRREILKLTGIASMTAAFAAHGFGQVPPSLEARLKLAHDRLADYLTELVPGAKLHLRNGATLLMPQAGGGYSGVWPDDSLYPLMALPSLANKEELQKTIEFISGSAQILHHSFGVARLSSPGNPNWSSRFLSPWPFDAWCLFCSGNGHHRLANNLKETQVN
ncbi:MAG TPA: hypothetical protein VKO18_00990 [Terriglobia bacterium]|nr:hypothetical protein [Terriglobia bacterium]